MPIKDYLSKFDIPPKVSFVVALVCLLVVLLNNHLYLESIAEREKFLQEETLKIQAREESSAKRERTLRLWEAEVMDREREVSRLIRGLQSSRSGEKGGLSTPVN